MGTGFKVRLLVDIEYRPGKYLRAGDIVRLSVTPIGNVYIQGFPTTVGEIEDADWVYSDEEMRKLECLK